VILPLLTLALLSPGPSVQDFASQWLEPVAVVERVYYVPAENDPNLLLRVTVGRVIHRVDMSDFAEFSRHWLVR
jgi:hypothetical protein